jgi:hypothetical protein
VTLHANSAAGRLCSACYARSIRVDCSRCGRFQPPNRRDGHGRPICATCVRGQRSAEATEAMRASIVAVVARVEPLLDEASIRAATVAAAPNLRHTDWLSEALAGGEDALLGGSLPPPVVDRLVAELQARGATNVVAPTCFGCATTRSLTQRVDGLRACNWCAIKARPELCGRCGQVAPVSTRDRRGGAVCYSCRGADPDCFEVCTGCARRLRVSRRGEDGGALCNGCGRRHPVVACSVCGRLRHAVVGSQAGAPRCGACSRRRATCSGCGLEDRIVAVVWASGPVCSTCHKKGLSAKGDCKGCGQRRRIDPRDPRQLGLCSDCAGLEPWSVCAACGIEERIYEAGRCVACTLDHRLRELVGASAVLDPLRESLLATDGPRAALRWLAKPECQKVLGAIARGDLAATHEGLDELGDSHWLAHLRQVLVVAGVLVERDEQTARLEAWVHAQLEAMDDAEDRRVVDAFANWWVLRRYRGRMERAGVSSDKHSRTLVLGAVAFMAWLRHHDLALGACTQAHVELWLTGPPVRRHARDFLRWACRRRLAHDIDIVRRPNTVPGRSVDAEAHLALARRFASDDTLALVDRVAGLFLLCYGQPLARMVRLTADHVSAEPGATSIRFGRTDVDLPEATGQLVRELIATHRGRAVTGAPERTTWLFPGAHPGRPLSSNQLGVRLSAYGLDARAARTNLMLDLAAEGLAPSFLADLLGLHPGTAVKWVHAAGGDWTGYVAARRR